MGKAPAWLVASALSAGVAAAEADAGAAVPLRLIVQLVQPMAAPSPDDQAEMARRATEAAGVPVAYGAAVSADRIALQLTCVPAECDAAVQRLRDAKTLLSKVERDERRRRHSMP